MQEGYDSAKRILTERLEDLHSVAKALLEFETLSGDEIINAMKGIPPVRDDSDTLARPSGMSVSVPLTHAPDPGPQPA